MQTAAERETRFKVTTDCGRVLELVPSNGGGAYLWLGEQDGTFLDSLGPAGLRGLRDALTAELRRHA